MRLIVLFLVFIFTGLNAQCPLGDEFVRSCTNGKWDKCPSDNYREGKRADGTYTCVCKNLPLSETHPSVKRMQADIKNLKASDAKQNIKISALQKNDANQDVEITSIKSDVNNLKGRMGIAEDEIKKRPKEITFKEPEKITEKSVEKPDPTKKGDPSLGPPREAPKVEVQVESPFSFEPELGLFAIRTKSPEYNSKWLYTGEVGVRLLLEPHKWHGFGIFIHPKYSFGLNKSFIPESDGSAYVQQLENKSGALVDVSISYKPIKYTEVFGGYAFSLSEGSKHHSGFLAGLESGWDFHSRGKTLELRAQLGLICKHDLSFFGGVVARLPIKFKPKA